MDPCMCPSTAYEHCQTPCICLRCLWEPFHVGLKSQSPHNGIISGPAMTSDPSNGIMRQRCKCGTMGGQRRPCRSRCVNRRCVVGPLWIVLNVGIRRAMYQNIVDAFPIRWGKASPSASELLARQPPHRIGRYAASSEQVHHGGMMHGNSGEKIGGRGAGGDIFYNRRIYTTIYHGVRHRPTAIMGPHSRLLSIHAISEHTMEHVYIIKTRKHYHY
jgi:hypothetical protein